MGMQALRAATQVADGRGSAKAILQMVLRHYKLRDANALVTCVYRPEVTHADIAGLVDPLMDLAGAGDSGAGKIVEQGARDLAHQINVAIQRLGIPRPPLALTGGVLRRVAFKQALLSFVTEELGPVTMVSQPYVGAVTLAKRLLAPARSR